MRDEPLAVSSQLSARTGELSDLYAIESSESARERTRRRLQQRRCLVCGARDLVNRQTSYFCSLHISAYRYCSSCETLRTTEDHGKDSRCRSCSGARALVYYHTHSNDANIYRIRLRQIATRTTTRGDQILAGVRRRIALAELVRATPGLSWPKRAALVACNAQQLANAYRAQLRGPAFDVDAADRARDAHWSARCVHGLAVFAYAADRLAGCRSIMSSPL